MKAHTQTFKDNIKTLGRELDSKITYQIGGETIELGNETLNSITPHYEADILKSVMKQLDIDSNVDIPIGTEVNYKFGLKVREGKNLFDASLIGSYTTMGVNVSQQEQEIILSGTPTRAWGSTPKKQLPQTLKAGKTYYFSSNSRVPVRLWFYASTTTTTILSNVAYNTSFTPSEDINAFAFVFEGLTVGQNYNETFHIQIEEGNQPTSYEEYSPTGAYDYLDYGNYIVYSSEKQEDTRSYKIVAYDKMLYAMKEYQALVSKNMFDKSVANLNKGVSTSTGGLYNSDINFSTDYIPITPGTYVVNGVSSVANRVYGAIYNSSKAYLSAISTAVGTKTFTITDNNVAYIRLTGLLDEIDTYQLEEGSTATNFVPYINGYPMTIKNYLWNLCDNIGLAFKNTNFVNYDKELTSELYLDNEGNSLNYTYRDVLDEIAGATASTICINEDDELEVRYVKATQGNLLDKNSLTEAPSNDDNWMIYTLNNVTSSTFSNDGWTVTTPTTGNDNNGRGIRIKNANNIIPAGTKVTFSIDITGSAVFGRIKGFYRGAGTALYSNNVEIIANTQTTSNDTIRYSGTFIMPDVGTLDTSFAIVLSQGKEQVTTRTYKNAMLEFGDGTYYSYSGDNIDEEYLKDINVNFGEKYGPVNSIVFSRSAESDNIFRQDTESVQENGLTEIKIVDNQILNSNARDTFIDGVFNQLNGFSYYANDYTSTGIAYYDVCDRYNVKVDDNIYSCVMLNDELDITQGLEEKIHTDIPEQSETDYKKADKTDRKINQAYIIVDKQNQQIDSVVQTINQVQVLVDNNNEQVEALGTRLTQTENNLTASITSVQEELDNGVGLVKTTMVTIDDSGLNVSTSNSKISTSMTNEAFTINSSDKELAFFGYDRETNSTRAEMDNLTITNYLTMGNHRVEKFERDGEERTGFFYIGGR